MRLGYFNRFKSKVDCFSKTVLENSSLGHVSPPEEDVDQWEQSFMFREEHENTYVNKWNKSNWCRPSCVPISVILILIVLVVLVPLLDHSPSSSALPQKTAKPSVCSDRCRFDLVESLPSGLIFPPDSIRHIPTTEAWLDLIGNATKTIEIGSMYWTMRENEIYPHNSSKEGEMVFQALLKAGTKRKIQVKIAQSIPTKSSPNSDTELLVKRKAAQVRSLNFPKLLGGGVLHTKLWLIDRKHFYIGSANMDWRSLTQVKELGAVVYNCSCLAEDIGKIFDVYWSLGHPDATVPNTWPDDLKTDFNSESPLNISYNDVWYDTYVSSSPPPLCPSGRTWDVNAVTDIISSAEKFVYIAVMDYFPLLIYKPKIVFWPTIDNAIRKAALQSDVKIKMLISWWTHSRPSEDYFLRSLTALTDSYKGISIEVKRFVMPATADEKKIPYARVNHNKYMVTDLVAYIGTSNWSGDYFTDTAGVGLVISEQDASIDNATNASSLRAQLQDVFERDWNSPHAIPLVE